MDTATTFHDADPDVPPAQACLAAYFDVLARVIPGLTPLGLPLYDGADYRPPSGAFDSRWGLVALDL